MRIAAIIALLLLTGGVAAGDGAYPNGVPVVVPPVPGAPVVERTMPLRLTCGDGGGDRVPVDCTAIDGPEDITVQGPDGETTLPYEVERLPSPGNPGIVWVYGRWARNGGIQATVSYGEGKIDRQDVDGPWNAGQGAVMVHHLAETRTGDGWTRDPRNPITPTGYNDPSVTIHNGTHLLYAARRGIELFTSPDGVAYSEKESVLTQSDVNATTIIDQEVVRAPNGSDRRYWMFYQTDASKIRIAKSDLLRSGWEPAGVLLSAGDVAATAISEPTIIHDPGAPDPERRWKMLFSAGAPDVTDLHNTRPVQTWYAYSPDGDGNWTVSRNNPVLSISEGTLSVQDADLYRKDGLYYQYVNYGSPDISKFVSTDMVNWTRDGDSPVLERGPEGSWDGRFLFAPDIVHDPATGDTYMVYQGGRIADEPGTGGQAGTFAIGVAHGQVTGPNFALDSSGNANHGRVSRVTRPVPGMFGTAYRFDGQGNVTVDAATPVEPATGFTVSAWMRPATDATASVLRSRQPLGLPLLRQVETPPISLEPERWHLVTGTYNGSVLTVAVDGKPAARTPVPPGAFDPTTLVTGPDGTGRTMTTVVDEVRVYDGPKDRAWITAALAAGDPGSRFFTVGTGPADAEPDGPDRPDTAPLRSLTARLADTATSILQGLLNLVPGN